MSAVSLQRVSMGECVLQANTAAGSQGGLSGEGELDDFTKNVPQPENKKCAHLGSGKKGRKIRRMGLILCCCFTAVVLRKRVRIGNWWEGIGSESTWPKGWALDWILENHILLLCFLLI